MHEEAVPGYALLHRDLKPDNICLLPLLSDDDSSSSSAAAAAQRGRGGGKEGTTTTTSGSVSSSSPALTKKDREKHREEGTDVILKLIDFGLSKSIPKDEEEQEQYAMTGATGSLRYSK